MFCITQYEKARRLLGYDQKTKMRQAYSDRRVFKTFRYEPAQADGEAVSNG